MSNDGTRDMIVFDSVSLTLGDHHILRRVSLAARTGETTVILGPSGSGKTTVLRLILGLYKPDAGRIIVRGHDITEWTERELTAIRRDMAMVFQTAALFDSLSVRENVGYRLWEQGEQSDAQIEARVRESLCFVGLEDTMDKMPAQLSGGMRKRVGIARALASGAPILLYDEPTSGLDPINTCLISRLIRSLNADGRTQVVVTHDLDAAYFVADHIIMMQKGRVIFAGTPERLKTSADPTIRRFLDPSTMTPAEHRTASQAFED
jgi:phospholipid/cholesterol/gamma-HCH transport system ATP-binding protein